MHGANFQVLLENQPTVFHCPSLASSAPSLAGSSSSSTAPSYGVNMCLYGMMSNDSNKIIVTDAASELLQFEGATQQDWNNDIAPRHNGTVNVLFFDGHVRGEVPSIFNPYTTAGLTNGSSPSTSSSASSTINVVQDMWAPTSGQCSQCGGSGSSASGGGLLGTYYPGQNNEWGSPSYTRIDSSMTYPFGGNGTPYNEPVPGASSGSSIPLWTATWTGQVMAQKTEPYTFWARVNNVVTVYVNGQQILYRSTGEALARIGRPPIKPSP